jgi:RsiW-degrading membrane proteinase PrsW (M82 family)
MQSAPASTLLSIMVICAFALGAGGLWLIVRRRDFRKGPLMLLAGAVLLGNVLVWTL